MFTAAEQKFYLDKGFVNEPKRCKACRAARKSQVAGGHTRRSQPSSRGGRLPAGQMGPRAAPIFKADFGPVEGPSPDRGRRHGGHGRQSGHRGRDARAPGRVQPGRAVPVRRDPTWRFRGYQGRHTQPSDGQPGRRHGAAGGGLEQRTGGRRGGPRHDARHRSPAVGGAYRLNIGGLTRQRPPDTRGGAHAERSSKTRRYEAVCTDCGAGTQVPFRPNGVSPVYCRTCLPRHKSRRGRPSPHRGDAARGA